MEIILLQDIEKVGQKHAVIAVKDGFARNYLIPQKMAVIANAENLRKLEDIKRREEEEATRQLEDVQSVVELLKDKV